MSALEAAEQEVALIAIRWLRSIEQATGNAAAGLTAMLDDVEGDPTPAVRGTWQRKIAPLPGLLLAQGLTASEIAREVTYDEANVYTVLASLEKSGLMEQVEDASPKRWRLAYAHRRNPVLHASHVIKQGEWTTYGDMAAAVSGNVNHARSVARVASTNPAFANPHRVLNAGGKISPEWHDEDGQGPEECERRLHEDGLDLVDGVVQGPRIDYETIRERLAAHDDPQEEPMPNMGRKASEIDDPVMLISRVAYRTMRMLDKIDEKDDPAAFVRIMAGHDRADLRRAIELMTNPPGDRVSP
jgi:alkylated DNA nucleotide flippase Atl1